MFLGTSKALVDMMNTMESAQLFENGEYMVIFVDMMTYSPREAKNYLWSEYTHYCYSNHIQALIMMVKYSFDIHKEAS